MARPPRTLAALVASIVVGGGHAAAQAPPAPPEAEAAPAFAPVLQLDEATKAASKRAARRGRKLLESRRPAEAVPALEEAVRLWPLPHLAIELARCLEAAGDGLRALGVAEGARALARDADELEAVDVEVERLREVAGRTLGEVRITTTPPGAAIVLAGEPDPARGGEAPRIVGVAPYAGWLPPGAWTLEVSAEGWETHKDRITVTAGAAVRYPVKLVSLAELARIKAEADAREAAQQAAIAAARAEDEARDRREAARRERRRQKAEEARVSARRTVAAAVLSAGALVVGGGAYLGVLAGRSRATLEGLKDGVRRREEVDAAYHVAASQTLSSAVLAGAGLAVAGLGGWLLWTAADEGGAPAATVAWGGAF